MVRQPGVGAPAPDTTAIDLTRMLDRLQKTLVTPDSATETKLRASSYEREKVGINLEHARSLLLRLEQDTQQQKVQSKKQEIQTDLIRKRETLQMLAERLQELNELGNLEIAEDESSDGEDLLGEDTPEDEDEDEQEEEKDPWSPVEDEQPIPPTTRDPELIGIVYASSSAHPEPNVFRARNKEAEAQKEALFSGRSTGRDTGASTATTEALLTHNRTEQESLTSSLLNMASALKESSKAFASSLESEKDILGRATEGLDKNELGLETAQRKMGFLRGYTEGKGWWGRMVMYVWIAGLMLLALIIVFVLPKLRF